MADQQELVRRHSYHPPLYESVARLHESIRLRTLEIALYLNRVLPEGREKSCALTAVQEAMMWSNAAVAIGQSRLDVEGEAEDPPR
jgi:hypothetical protein